MRRVLISLALLGMGVLCLLTYFYRKGKNHVTN